MKMVLALREKPDQESFQWTRFGKVMFEHCHDRGASEAHANASMLGGRAARGEENRRII